MKVTADEPDTEAVSTAPPPPVDPKTLKTWEEAGLMAQGAQVPLRAVHVSAKLLDLVRNIDK